MKHSSQHNASPRKKVSASLFKEPEITREQKGATSFLFPSSIFIDRNAVESDGPISQSPAAKIQSMWKPSKPSGTPKYESRDDGWSVVSLRAKEKEAKAEEQLWKELEELKARF